MFDIGFWEILLIGVIGLLVIGPERLPDVARTLGRWVGKIRQFVGSVKSDIEQELRTDELKRIMDQQQSEISELRQALDNTRAEVEKDHDYVVKAIKDEPPTEADHRIEQDITERGDNDKPHDSAK